MEMLQMPEMKNVFDGSEYNQGKNWCTRRQTASKITQTETEKED